MQILLCMLLAAAPEWELTTSLSYIYSAVSDGNGGVWCASSGGAFHYSPSEGIDTIYSCPEQLPLPDCRDILKDSSGRLWFATGGEGLVMFDGNNWSTYSSFEGIPGQGIVTSLAESAGEIWVGCSGGFAHGDINGFTPVGDALSADDVYSVSTRNDTLWLCTNKGIFSLHDPGNPLNPASWEHWEETQFLQLRKVRVGTSAVYACGDSGAVALSPGMTSFQYILDYSQAADSSVIDIMETGSGLLAACRGIVYRQAGESWEKEGTGLPMFYWPTCLFEIDETVHCGFTYQTTLGNLVNTQSGLGFYSLSQNIWTNFTIPGLQSTRVHQMASADDGRLYAATYQRGVQAYYPGYGWRGYESEDGMPSGFQTFSLTEDPDNGIWASSYHYGLSWIRDNGDWFSEGDTIITFVRDSIENYGPNTTIVLAPIPNNQPVIMANQSNGVWVGFEQFDPAGAPDESSGILGMNGDPLGTMNWAGRTENSGIAAVSIQSLYPVSNDSLWISFKNGGGCQLLVHSGNPADDSEDTWYPGSGVAYSTVDGLPSGEVFCFTSLPGVGLIAGTSSGLAKWTGSGFTEYGDITEPVKTMYPDRTGRLWCLSESGIYRVIDGESSIFNALNSDFKPSTPYDREYSTEDEISGGVFFSSIKGLWTVFQAGDGGSQNGSGLSFYPQPFIYGEDVLYFTGPEENIPVTVDFFRLSGSYAGTVEATSVSQWSWDGSLNNKIVASGVYIVIVTVGDTVFTEKITVVR